MSNVTIALTLENECLDEIEDLADEMRISASQVLEMAAKQFVQQHKEDRSSISSETANEMLPTPQI